MNRRKLKYSFCILYPRGSQMTRLSDNPPSLFEIKTNLHNVGYAGEHFPRARARILGLILIIE